MTLDSPIARLVAPCALLSVALAAPASAAADDDASSKGGLSKDLIRRVVRAHIDDVRHCYNQGLQSNPKLKGRVAVNFVIVKNGQVSEATAAEDSLGHSGVPSCILGAVRTWRFPELESGESVTVTYPFVLQPD